MTSTSRRAVRGTHVHEDARKEIFNALGHVRGSGIARGAPGGATRESAAP